MNEVLLQLRKEIEQAILDLELPKDPANLYDPMKYILSLGGKRIRPLMTLLGGRLYGVSSAECMSQAMAVEVFHNFTLVHDDIMDSADVRRKLPTVHKKWDHNIALLSGDGMMIYAYQILVKAPSDRLPDLLEVFSSTAMEVCEGQQKDMDYAMEAEVHLDQYMEMIRQKTAVLLGGAMQLGAIMGGAPKSDLAQIQEFAENLGLAFQIMDDFLDSFGSKEDFGKQIGGDIKEGKNTWLKIRAYDDASETQLTRLKEAFANNDIDERISDVLALYKEIEVDRKAEQEIARLSDASLSALEQLRGDEATKHELKSLVNYLMGRTS